MEKLLTVELNNNNESIEIHMNLEGVDFLIEKLNSLKSRNITDHEHLMTPDWGGNDLTITKQNKDENVKLINHLRLCLWI